MKQLTDTQRKAYERMDENDIQNTIKRAEGMLEEGSPQEEIDAVSEVNTAEEVIRLKREGEFEEDSEDPQEWGDLFASQKAERDLDRYLQEEGFEDIELGARYVERLEEGLQEHKPGRPDAMIAALVRDQDMRRRRELSYEFGVSEELITKETQRLDLAEGAIDHIERNVEKLTERFSNFEEFNEEYEGIIEDYTSEVPGARPEEMGAVLEYDIVDTPVGVDKEDVMEYFGASEEGFARAQQYEEDWKHAKEVLH